MRNHLLEKGAAGMQRKILLVAVLLIWGLVGVSTAQDGEYRSVDNPFQDEFDFTVNSNIEPLIEVDGIRWRRFGLHVKTGREIDTEKDVPVTVENDLLNTTGNSAKVMVIVLLEDAAGTPLDRIECNAVSVGADRLKESVQKFKIHGAVLEATRKIYLFYEIQR
jgi:hypothetical protein